MALPAVGDAPLPSAVPPCRRCGKPMEPGWVEGDGAPVGSAGTISWSGMVPGELEDLARCHSGPGVALTVSPRFGAQLVGLWR